MQDHHPNGVARAPDRRISCALHGQRASVLVLVEFCKDGDANPYVKCATVRRKID